MFTDRDVVSGNKVCVIGKRIVRELFQGESPVGQAIRIQNVSLRVVGVLSRKGANTLGMDQDDIVLAPWTTIKYRVAGNSAGNVNQSAASATTSAGTSVTVNTVNTLSNLYPGSTALYLAPSPPRQPTRRSRCASPTSIKSWSRRGPPKTFPRRSTSSPTSCANGTTCARTSPATSTSAT